MRIYIDNTKTLWLDIKTYASGYIVDEVVDKYITSYRIVSSNDVIHGKLTHNDDLTIKEKEELIIKGLKELVK